MNKEKKYVPELKIPFEDYREYLVYNDVNKNEDLEILAEDLVNLIVKNEEVAEYITGELLAGDRLEDDLKREIVEDFGFEIQPEVWKMNASGFKRYLCEILELNYHTSHREILEVISEKMEGKR